MTGLTILTLIVVAYIAILALILAFFRAAARGDTPDHLSRKITKGEHASRAIGVKRLHPSDLTDNGEPDHVQ